MDERAHVPSPTLGTKRVCPSCGARFYDLNNKPISCPKCAFSFEPDVLLKPRRPRTPEKAKAAEVAPVVAKDEEAPDYEEEAESEETVEDEAEEVEEEVEEEPVVVATNDDEEEEDEAKPAVAPKGRRGATEEVDPDLIEVDEDEALDGDEEEDDDTLIEPDEEGDSDLSDIEIGKDDEDR
jgi:uncharacterized protein (TIGR02300 family)